MPDVDDLLGPAPRKTRKVNSKKVDDLLGPIRRADGKRKYEALKPPENPEAGGIFARRKAKGRNLGRTCLICNVELRHKRGRPPVVCRKAACFREYRNLYRRDYYRVRP